MRRSAARSAAGKIEEGGIFCEADRVVQLGHPPNRIDVITGFSGVTFEETWEEREAAQRDGLLEA
jgi:hypothetical protein